MKVRNRYERYEFKARRSQLLSRIEELQVTLDETSDHLTFYLDTPRGKVFGSNLAHCMACPYHNNGGQSWKAQAYYEALRDLEHGLKPCNTPDCEACQNV